MTKVAFACSTIFHYEHLKRIADKFANCVVIMFTPLESENTNRLRRHLEQNKVQYCHISEVLKQEHDIDVLFSVYWQPSFLMLGSRIMHARVMYGYAKDDWNYGEWNKNYDVIFTYGPYANRKLSHLAACVEVGHPRATSEVIEASLETSRNNLIKPISILYCPTYGELSSMDEFDSMIPILVQEGYSISIKLHHLSDYSACPNIMDFHGRGDITIYDESTDLFDLLPTFELVISDHSGAIFDAMLLEKKILLIDSSTQQSRIDAGINNSNASLDITIRQFVTHCAIDELPLAIEQVLYQPIGYMEALSWLFARRGSDVGQNIHDEILNRYQSFNRRNKLVALYHRLIEFVQKDNRHVVICGAGNFGEAIFFNLKSISSNSILLIDSDSKKANSLIDGVAIGSTDHLQKMSSQSHKFIVATVVGAHYYEDLLNVSGFEKDSDYFCAY